MKTALITGASRGIGSEIAKKFAENGYNIILNYNRSQENAIKLKNELEINGVNVLVVKCDVSDETQVKNMVEIAIKTFGHIDVLVNNAGIDIIKLLIDSSEKDFDDVFGTNVKGTFFCLKHVLPSMISYRYGRVINISSCYSKTGAACESLYSASKSAITNLTLSLAKEYANANININSISPGAVKTDMLACYDDNEIEDIKNSVPLKRLGTPRDIANVVYFLSTEEASYITGQNIFVDGGLSL